MSTVLELPINHLKDELIATIRDHQVVIVAGETGSGKTTQLPKICLELGRGSRGMIGHTQPRRIAARSVASRIAEELGTDLGGVVGFQVRFSSQVSDRTLIKVMTDGILLAELTKDRRLARYDTLIIDEAHERSLNIDFILGYLRQLLPQRPDLKVVITSATIDPERFSRHFEDAPVIEVSGRTYPVEVRYRPLDERDQTQAIGEAVDELIAEGPGDILVFLSGEREIRDTADVLRGQQLTDTEIVPLFSRLSTAEQHRIFAAHRGRRIVLATNIAETSLTVPGVKYVIDPGTARISRYSNRLKVQRLPIEPVSRASASQRAGRCGRLAEGICIRLYSKADFEERPEFTDPEILRTNLASVILQMAALDLADLGGAARTRATIGDFPFIDPPDRRHVKDGMDLLRELGALDERVRLTPIGRKLAHLPIDPRLARMVVAAQDGGCVREVLVIAAALSIQDPRERPADAQQAADQLHARFADPSSDFLAYLNLWDYLKAKQRELSGNQFRRLCRTEHLHYLRVREWQDLEAQLRQAARPLGIRQSDSPLDPDRIHSALLSGLLSHIGMYDSERRDYLGARNARFAINPGSALFTGRSRDGGPAATPRKAAPRWVMAAELVETSRLWARVVARIQPEVVEPLAAHLVKRSYSEPHWEKRRGAVVAYEKVTLYGIPLVTGRKVAYGKLDPELCRELFIRHALVEGDWDTHHRFWQHNQDMRAELAELEHRARRRDIVVDDEVIFDFYDERLPPDIVSARHFDAWWKRARRTHPDLLDLDAAQLRESTAPVSDAHYPDVWQAGSLALPLTYQFEPGADTDGVTVHIPLAALNQVGDERFDWQVPGLRAELVTALIRSLPKALRRSLVPAADHAENVLDTAGPADGPLLDVLSARLGVPRDAWAMERVPAHLRMTLRVVDDSGEQVAEGKDLTRITTDLRSVARAELAAAAPGIERHGLRTWDIGALPRVIEVEKDGYVATGFPALHDEGESVAVRIFDTEDEQRAAMWAGNRRLLLLAVPSPITYLSDRLSNEAKLILARNPHGSVGALLDDCAGAALDLVMSDGGGPAWDRAGFERLAAQARADLNATMLAIVGRVAPVLAAVQHIERQVPKTPGPALADSVADITSQLSRLVYPGFVVATGYRRLADLQRYLRGIAHRLERLPANPARDRELTARIHEIEEEYEGVVAALPATRGAAGDVREIRWMLEELRISYFAQAQRTAYPISDKRIRRALDALE